MHNSLEYQYSVYIPLCPSCMFSCSSSITATCVRCTHACTKHCSGTYTNDNSYDIKVNLVAMCIVRIYKQLFIACFGHLFLRHMATKEIVYLYAGHCRNALYSGKYIHSGFTFCHSFLLFIGISKSQFNICK